MPHSSNAAINRSAEPLSMAFSHDDIVLQLGQYYGQVKRQILRYQSATSGLFPRLSNDEHEAHIRDSIYCAAAVWSLYVAYTKRIDDDRGKAHDLGQSVVKCMRGILFAWMRQSEEKMEFFKANQSPKHALHSKFSLHTALSSDADYPHLQIDVVSLYLLFLAQMISSGLQIIYCLDEVTFVQNLVYYVERAYRTPDYGNWEQDSNPTNSSHNNFNNKDKSLEIHSTSIGMAKAALEAINGCNLFGDKGANWSIIYVDVDAHSRNRSIFETLLPRESRSKNTDSYLLATISWPCFATHDPTLYASTKKKILKKLSGKYGLRRFLRDAYGTVIESEQQQQDQLKQNQTASLNRQRKSSVLARPYQNHPPSSVSTSCLNIDNICNQHQHYYRPSCMSHQSSPYGSTSLLNYSFSSQNGDEFSGTTSPTLIQVDDATKTSKKFEHIESEWPLFVCFLIIDGIFKNKLDQVHENEKLLFESLLKMDPKYKDYLMPKYYFVPTDLIQSERREPDSVERCPSYEGSNSECIYLMGQSLLLIARLLLNGLVQPSELDPIKRYMPSHDRPKKLGRYSSFQGKTSANSSDLVVQTVLITESIRLQAMMATYGIQTQTPLEVEPVQIWSSSQLVEVYELLGVNKKLGLRGRPDRPIGSLGTSKLYRICGQTILCYPLIFEVSDFYLSQDMALLIDDIQNELNFVGRYWRMSGRPTVCILIREEHLKDIHFRGLLDLLVEFKQGQLKKSGLKIKTGRLQNLISSSCIEHLDFLHLLPKSDLPQFKSFQQLDESLDHSLLNYQTLLATNHDDSLGTSMTNLTAENLEQLSNVHKVVNYFDLYKKSPTWPTIIDAFRSCETLYGQSQILGLLWNREGPEFKIDELTLEERLEHLSRLAGQVRNWSVVRYCSSILKRSVESISPWITSILVNGKHISVGYSKDEKIIDNPLTPSEIHCLIYSTVSSSNPCDAVLQQEIALYIGRLISTKPELFDGILTIRVGNFMSAMRSYLKIKTNHSYMHKQLQYNTLLNAAISNNPTIVTPTDIARHHHLAQSLDPLLINNNNNNIHSYTDQRLLHSSASNYSVSSMGDDQPTDLSIQSCRHLTPPVALDEYVRPLESLSPSDVRKLVIKVLTDDESLPISDRRQITGEICRVPRDFYDKVWCLLGCTSVGIVIGGRMLRSLPTLTHMSQHDLNFALKVESLLSRITDPKLRQINVELLMALHVVSERNPEIRFDHEPLDLDNIIKLSLEKFRQDHNKKDIDLAEFYCMTTTTTMLYSVRTIFDILLPSHKYQECKIA